ncbi:MAG TPA: hypothetical protein VLB27_09305 [candidate division Zixibacteria bacterium]|nr:hypothetical protein [candidate division Zixibacteria bacterium]
MSPSRPEPTPRSRSSWRQPWSLAGLALLVALSAIRFVNLSADPPLRLTTSQGVYTDPAAYTLYARSAELYGDSNPLGDERFPLFEYSAVSGLATVVFALFGVGYAQGNTVALLFSIGAILLLYLVLRRRASAEAAVFALALLALNLHQYHYGRLPFLEHAMIFFGVLSFWLTLSFGTRVWGAAAAGAVAAAAFLFGKTHGVSFVATTGVFFIWKLAGVPNTDAEAGARMAYLKRVVFPYALGVAALSLVWYVAIGRGALPVIREYLAEQSTGLYGAPEAFTSPYNFFWKLFSLGAATKLYHRMVVASLCAAVVVGLFCWRWITGRRGAPRGGMFNDVTALFVIWFAAVYIELFPWNYRPLRYQLPLIYAACGLAGLGLGYLWRNACEIGERLRAWSRPGWTRLTGGVVALWFLAMFPVYAVHYRYSVTHGSPFYFKDEMWVLLGLAGGVVALIFLIAGVLRAGKVRAGQTQLYRGVVVVALAVSLGTGAAWFSDWLDRPMFTTVAVSQDLAKALSPGAVIAGSYGPGLSSENRFQTVIHMFGVADPDTSFFERFPVTHLLVDESSRKKFEELHPDVAAGSHQIHTYHVVNRRVHLVRVAGSTGNPRTDGYQLSAFEKAQLVFDQRLEDPEGEILRELMFSDTINLAINMYMAGRAERAGSLQDAAFFVNHALDACPSDYNLWGDLGRLYSELYARDSNEVYKMLAGEAFSESQRINPWSARIAQELEKIEGDGIGD